jgi:hypothetical protein
MSITSTHIILNWPTRSDTKKEDNIQIYMLICHNKIMSVYVNIESHVNTQPMCEKNTILITW